MIHWFMYASSVVVAIIGLAGLLYLSFWAWLMLFEFVAKVFKIHSLFSDFIVERSMKRPVGNVMSDEEVAELKRRTGR